MGRLVIGHHISQGEWFQLAEYHTPKKQDIHKYPGSKCQYLLPYDLCILLRVHFLCWNSPLIML